MLQNVYRVEGDVAYLTLTLGQETKVDLVDLAEALRVRWHAAYIPSQDVYYARSKVGSSHVTLHRYLMKPPEGLIVDHINHDTLDNRRANLRIATYSENRINLRGAQKDSATGVLNVNVQRLRDGRIYYVAAVARNRRGRRKNFPYTPEGLAAAKAQAEEWRKDFEAPEPPRRQRAKGVVPDVPDGVGVVIPARVTSKTGIRGVSVHNPRGKWPAYVFRCQVKECPEVKYFPFSDDGLAAAKVWSESHYAKMIELVFGEVVSEP